MAIVNLDVNVRVRDRFEFKVNSRSGTRFACLPSPFTTVQGRRLSRRAGTAACPTRRGFKATACYSLRAVAKHGLQCRRLAARPIQLRRVTHRARGVLTLLSTMPEVRTLGA